MKVNQSSVERIIRGIVGAALLTLYLTGFISGGWGIVALVLGALLLLTGVTGFCPVYALLKINTNKSG